MPTNFIDSEFTVTITGFVNDRDWMRSDLGLTEMTQAVCHYVYLKTHQVVTSYSNDRI